MPITPQEEPVRLHGPDTLQILVKVKEKAVNYDSIFRSMQPAAQPEPAAALPRKTADPPLAGPAKQQKIIPPGTAIRPQPDHPHAGIPRAAATRVTYSQDLAARGIMTAGLTLILLAVVLELFFKRKGLAFLVIGMVALLAGLTLL